MPEAPAGDPTEAPPPGTARIVVGVSGIARRDGLILLVLRGREPYAGCWSLPGGKVRPMEPHLQALVREFLEETGLQVRVDRPAGIAEGLHPATGRHYLVLSYFVDVTGGEPQPGDDARALCWLSREELPELPLTPDLDAHLEDFGAWS